MLHLTNGSAVIPMMRDAGVIGRVIPWDDVLHDGPVPMGMNPVALRERRAEFLASCGWGSAEEIGRKLTERDLGLEQALGGTPLRSGGTTVPPYVSPSAYALPVDEIVLWFEHDLYDQLQLIQILDRLPLDGTPRVTAVPDDDYLGNQPVTRFQEMFKERREVTSSERLAARDAWTAFRSTDPRSVLDVIPRVTELRHLGPALRRHLQQFPSLDNGLSRTERQTLEVVSSGVRRVRDVYIGASHNCEEPVFLGDAGFLMHIAALFGAPRPLLRKPQGPRELSLDDEIELTSDGQSVLEGRLDRVAICGIHRWLGGVELSGNGPVWRWDRERETVRLG